VQGDNERGKIGAANPQARLELLDEGGKEPHSLGLEGIVSKRKDSPYRSGRSRDWLKMKNPACEAVTREEEEDWGKNLR
jgi:ATP-dependent DNA ligase